MLPDSLSIAIVEDDPVMGESLNQGLELEGCRVSWWRTGAEALAGLRAAAAPDVVICDIRLPDMSGEDVFRRLAADAASPPFLFMTAYGEIDQAVALIRAGGGDYVTKPFVFNDLLARARALAGRRPPANGGILGVSPAMRRVEAMIARVAARSSPVLLTGETGAGKEVCARLLHGLGSDATQPFIAVNCAAIPHALLESEMFGHEKGAFTGALARHAGYAERARRGTLFLDEVAELPLALQAKLLRLLDERRFARVGGETAVPFEARIVCATHRDLSEEVAAGRFRQDLYYRINVVAIEVPPLRDRPADIVLLLNQFFAEIAPHSNTALHGFSSLTEEAALAYPWPGNVRELRNRVERAATLALGEWLMPSDLFPEAARASDDEAPRGLAAARDAAERREIERALRDSGGHVGEAAKRLGIARTTLWERMRRLSIRSR
ncbi:sigma-54-dependent transcriptional regulator [Blastochloris tepida]|uniref:DNA-binding response regulator n=1 Tax=Blastochloris tepida TaxID=2233851 RepID=A0A348FYF5_9HYPH|nr:sigma-54 dependent transcriptional regulator [Blastochloris tepida]BBF92338.1 DNA-binding response regulator [Blastochloris tepida]